MTVTETIPQASSGYGYCHRNSKPLVFGGSFVLLCLARLVRYLTRNMPCPADPAQACARLRALGGIILWIGFTVRAIGAFSAFVLPKLLVG